MYCASLTKDELVNYGFVEPEWTGTEWKIRRYWYKCGASTTKVLKEITITKAVGKHKYTKPKEYLKITFACKNKTRSIPLSRFIYAWFYNVVPAGMDVEHISNDPFDNSLSNLRLCTRAENLAKRFTDNPENWTNQYGKKKVKEDEQYDLSEDSLH